MHSFFVSLKDSTNLRSSAFALAFLSLAGCANVPVQEDPMFFAVVKCDSRKVQALVEKQPDLAFTKSTKGATPLHIAAAVVGCEKVAEVLLANKADINARNDVGNTPLHIAEISANKEMAALLISKGADVNARNTGGDTPLHIAAAVGHADMVESLLAKGANANAKNTAGETPLRWAEKTGRKDMAEVLRKRGAHE